MISPRFYEELCPRPGQLTSLHSKVGIWQGLARRTLLGTLMPTEQGQLWSKQYLGTARRSGAQASLPILHFPVTLPTAKDERAMSRPRGQQIELGAKSSLQPRPHGMAAGRPPHSSLTFLICQWGEQSPSQRGPMRRK